MEEETLTNQDEPEVIENASTEAQPEALAPEQPESEGDEEEGQIETEEVEFNGKVYAVPKELAPNLMMQSDYTRKTQEVAELRKETEAERASWRQQAQIREALFEEKAELHQIDKRLNAYRNTNWQQWQVQDPNGYQAAMAEYTQLRDYKEGLNGRIQGREAELASQFEQSTVARLNKAVEALSKPDPKLGWDGKFDTPKREQLASFGKELGFSEEELAGTDHPLMIKTLQLAKIGYEALKKQQTAPARTPAEPAAKVPTSRASSPINAKTASMDAYAAARRAGKLK